MRINARRFGGHTGVSPSGKATDSDSVIREFKSLYPSQTKEQASACSFCFTCEAVEERFELRATPSGEKTVLRTVFSDDRRYLQSIGLNFRICFANIKRKISLPQPRGNNTNYEGNSRFVLFLRKNISALSFAEFRDFKGILCEAIIVVITERARTLLNIKVVNFVQI